VIGGGNVTFIFLIGSVSLTKIFISDFLNFRSDFQIVSVFYFFLIFHIEF